MVSQQLWLKAKSEKRKLNPLSVIKGLIIKEEDFVHAQNNTYGLHVRHPALGASNYDCMLTVSCDGKNIINVYPVPVASLEATELELGKKLIR